MTTGQVCDTQSPPEDYETFQSQSQEVKIYGRLSSCSKVLHSIVLDKPMYLFGRGVECDIVVNSSIFPPLTIQSISKHHFQILCDDGVCITDFSRNGTFINSKRIPKGIRRTLYHGDQIAVGTPSMRIYTFEDNDKMLCLPLALKQYKVLRQLGSGSYGEVWLALETRTNKHYAIKKVMQKDENEIVNGNDSSLTAKEVKIMKNIEHPCIIAIEEVVKSDNALFMVLEYMSGGELSSLMGSPNGPMPENIVKPIFFQLVSAIRYLHLRNITHRDIKPANILLQSKQLPPVVKLADFGLSKVIESTSHMTTVCGTLAYVAPEVIDPYYGPYTQQVDVWSLGVVLYAMLSNELPFKTIDDGDLRKSILCGQLHMTSAPWSFVSNVAKDLIKQMLMRNPDDRLTIHQVADHPWLTRDKPMLEQVRSLLSSKGTTSYPTDHDGRAAKKMKLE